MCALVTGVQTWSLPIYRHIKRSGGFVGNQKPGFGRQRNRDHDALLLPARELKRVVAQALVRLGYTDPFQPPGRPVGQCLRSEEHTSELQSLMRISYVVFCL